ncbi:MAG: inorganic pyrophosphatase [Anaerolineae bacterium CG_4_9_14_3_um_filter_57_17]|nr:inorganic pyrophosphatase [bacterium]NCT22088.1 inorganic pyrophosphatase [bacterium]OIO83808.1 MAG: inorganic pyrophosphatase [Anaerolineae bacterium CG2_30_57_67]PJB68732.1 MAG: inorganic pyrophosphatase [Anaerolineae bacterium CG_4_9_14_3_um_filter_57_17]
MKNEFWDFLDQLIASSEIVVDRPKGSQHPHYPEIIYPLDYGYLAGTVSADGDGIDLWLGSQPQKTLSAILVIVDLRKRDSEIKLLLGCVPQEIQIILNFHNSGSMRATLLNRPITQSQKHEAL